MAIVSKRYEAHTEDRIWSCSKNFDGHLLDDLISFINSNLEIYLCAEASANPSPLQLFHMVIPSTHVIKVVKHLISVLSNVEEPLIHQFLLHLRTGAPRASVSVNLFVGKDRLINWVPINIGFLPVGQAVLVEQREYFLSVLIIAWVMRGQFSIPIKLEAHAVELLLHVRNVLHGPIFRRYVPLNGSILSRQAERVPAHGIDHTLPLLLVISCEHIAYGVDPHMPHVYVSRWIGELSEYVHLFFRLGITFRLLFLCQPCLLPLPVNLLELIGERPQSNRF